MRSLLALICLLGGAAGLFAQGGVRGAYNGSGSRSVVSGGAARQSPGERGPIGPGWGGRRWIGGGWWGGGYWGNSDSVRPAPEQKAEPKEDKLKELIISPVYEAPKMNPKMIEIP